MSEYQCYEFVALDRPLTAKQMAELRALSTRAEISPTRFRNEYQWGDLKGDPAKLMERYFDAHLYFANWGTHRLILRMPKARADLKALRPYFVGGHAARLASVGDHVLLDLGSETEEPEYVSGLVACGQRGRHRRRRRGAAGARRTRGADGRAGGDGRFSAHRRRPIRCAVYRGRSSVAASKSVKISRADGSGMSGRASRVANAGSPAGVGHVGLRRYVLVRGAPSSSVPTRSRSR